MSIFVVRSCTDLSEEPKKEKSQVHNVNLQNCFNSPPPKPIWSEMRTMRNSFTKIWKKMSLVLAFIEQIVFNKGVTLEKQG